jgi:hypothetical protein
LRADALAIAPSVLLIQHQRIPPFVSI